MIGGRDEFMISVPSLCHCTYASSMGVWSGGPPGALPWATNAACQNPTIEGPSLSSLSTNFMEYAAGRKPIEPTAPDNDTTDEAPQFALAGDAKTPAKPTTTTA